MYWYYSVRIEKKVCVTVTDDGVVSPQRGLVQFVTTSAGRTKMRRVISGEMPLRTTSVTV